MPDPMSQASPESQPDRPSQSPSAPSLQAWLERAVGGFDAWGASFGPTEGQAVTSAEQASLGPALDELLARLGGNYPFFHPRYAGQMLKPPHPAAVIGYLAAMLHNPNNHALDGGPPTSEMEKELIPELAAMFHLPADSLGHLTSSGTIANLEALFVAREMHPGKAIAYSAEAHYTHSRMCHVLGVEGIAVGVDDRGRMDLAELEDLLRSGRVGTVVATAGTTGLGMVDPIEHIILLARRFGTRVHVDAAYGGFFTILAWAAAADANADASPEATPGGLVGADPTLRAQGGGGPSPTGSAASTAVGAQGAGALEAAASFRAIALADSVVIDPHKHGLQPYGCGAVLFADPAVGRFYVHDSPYTYFSSPELHLGEISLECSRAGAAAAALWLTRKVVPWTMDGLGSRLASGLRAATHWRKLLASSAVLMPYQDADLDIVTLLPRAGTLAEASAVCRDVFERAMTDATDPYFLATFGVSAAAMGRRDSRRVLDVPTGAILRSVLMKPEHELWVDRMHAQVEELVRSPR
jgi:glutamate/tyrosine decarboxylase-like PLP-dependent enzyme